MEENNTNGIYVVWVAAVAALGGLLFGFDTAVISGAIVYLKREFTLGDVQTEAAVSSILVGCILGASLAGWICDRFGRKRTLIGSAGLFLLSSVGAAVSMNVWQFGVARLIGGIAIGIASMLSPLYIAEIAPARARGRLVSLNQMAIVTGILAAYVVSWFLAGEELSSWRWMFASAAFPSLLFLVALLLVPESPRWLIQNGRIEEALRVLARFTNPKQAAQQLSSIQLTIAQEQSSPRDLWTPRMRKPLVIGIGLAILQQITGINTILYYGSIIFTEQVAQHSTQAIGANAVIGLINFLGTIAAILMIDRVGRRPLLLWTSAGMALALGGLGFAFQATVRSPTLLLCLILIYVACFAVGLGPGAWVVMSELFPTRVRGRAMSAATISLWVACLLITSTFLSLVQAIGASGAFWLYGAMSVLTTIFVWTLVPETKGQTLEQISGGSPTS